MPISIELEKPAQPGSNPGTDIVEKEMNDRDKDLKLPALCPDCGGKGCDECHEGFIQVTYPSGGWVTYGCLKCGFVASSTNTKYVSEEQIENNPYRLKKCIDPKCDGKIGKLTSKDLDLEDPKVVSDFLDKCFGEEPNEHH